MIGVWNKIAAMYRLELVKKARELREQNCGIVKKICIRGSEYFIVEVLLDGNSRQCPGMNYFLPIDLTKAATFKEPRPAFTILIC